MTLVPAWLLSLSVLVMVAAVLLFLRNPKVGELFRAHPRSRVTPDNGAGPNARASAAGWKKTGFLLTVRHCKSSGRLPRIVWSAILGYILFLTVLPVAGAQAPAAASQTPQSQNTPTTFKVRVNLILVPVVVRDREGKVVTTLKKEDFQLTDERKPQIISTFTVETSVSHVATVKMDSPEATSARTPVKAPELPHRFVSPFFDDLHLSTEDVMHSRLAATKLLAGMGAGERFAIFTTSGHVEQDFTAERAKLDQVVQKIMPNLQHSPMDCPPMTFFEAYQIVEMNDPSALAVAIQDAVLCTGDAHGAKQMAVGAAHAVLSIGESDLQFTYSSLKAVIRRMTKLNGQRVIVLMSPGFLVIRTLQQSSEVIDHATKGNVVINAIDARGLYAPSAFDASQPTAVSPQKAQLISTEEGVLNGALEELAEGTGGLFFHDRNDIDQVLQQAAAEPEVSYVLGFAPDRLKLDGRYHHIKVTLAKKQPWSVQARHGYFAPHGEADPATTANEEIQEALHSQAEMHEVPVECQTQFSKSASGVRLSVVARVDTKGLPFRKAADLNDDDVTVATAVFDNNGTLLSGQQKILLLRLKDATLGQINMEGMKTDFDFELQPGTFLVRIVVRDSEGAQMGTVNRGVVIP